MCSSNNQIVLQGYACQVNRNLDMQPGTGLVVDHINHDPLDNTRANLRVCTQGQNMKNQKKNKRKDGNPTSSKYKGVYKWQYKKTIKFKSTIWNNGEQKYLGYFDTEIEAAMAYDEAAREKHGVFAALNFP